MKTDGARAFRAGIATGVAILAVVYFALGKKGWQVFRIAMLPPALGMFFAKFFPSLTLESDSGEASSETAG